MLPILLPRHPEEGPAEGHDLQREAQRRERHEHEARRAGLEDARALGGVPAVAVLAEVAVVEGEHDEDVAGEADQAGDEAVHEGAEEELGSEDGPF